MWRGPLGAGLIAAAMLVASAHPARADEPSSTAPWGHSPPPPELWYGGDVLAADGIGLLLVLGCAKAFTSHEGSGPATCGAPFWLAGPAAHYAHEELGRSLLSLGLRITLPVAGFFIGSAYECHDCFLPNYAIEGILAGAAAAVIIDLVIAYEPAGPLRRSGPRRASELSPSVALTSAGVGVGLAGRF